MKTIIRNLFLLPLQIAGLVLMLPGPVTAQTFRTLYSFTATNRATFTSGDGANPQAGLILSNNTLYGTAANGGFSGHGTVFKVNTDGMKFTNLHSFTEIPPPLAGFTNIDGAYPSGGLILSGNTLYGTTVQTAGMRYEIPGTGPGTLFKVNTDGTGFKVLHSFGSIGDGAGPIGELILSGNTLYGTTYDRGDSVYVPGHGAVFKINTDGTGYTVLHKFTRSSDGANPAAGLILSGNTLYGTAELGGSGHGTVFAVNTDGTGFRVL